MKQRSKEKDGTLKCGRRGRFEMRLGGVLKSFCEKTNRATGEVVDGRRAASRGQIDFASLCDAGGFGGGN